MRLVVQRVESASVTVLGNLISEINNGFLVYLGIHIDDTVEMIDKYVRKLVNLRVFEDEDGKLNKSLKDVNGEVLLVSQFTLYGSVKRGNRPSFTEAMSGDNANLLYEEFIHKLKKEITVKTGVFGADMNISSVNKGPVTIIIENL